MNEDLFESWKKEPMIREVKEYREALRIYNEAWAPFLEHKGKVAKAKLLRYHPNDYPEEYKDLKAWPRPPIIKEPRNIQILNHIYKNAGLPNPFKTEPYSSIKTNGELVDKGLIVVKEIDENVYRVVREAGLVNEQTTIFTRKYLYYP